jgi:hypothetical protein
MERISHLCRTGYPLANIILISLHVLYQSAAEGDELEGFGFGKPCLLAVAQSGR